MVFQSEKMNLDLKEELLFKAHDYTEVTKGVFTTCKKKEKSALLTG